MKDYIKFSENHTQDYEKWETENLLLEKEKLSNEISRFSIKQQVLKCQLNSAYGSIGNEFFRYYDIKIAEAITLSGQLTIQWIANKLNEYMNKILGTSGMDFVIASDTDSIYLKFDNLIQKIMPEETDNTKIVNYLDKIVNKAFDPFIQSKFEELSELLNAYENRMSMGREVIANKGLWTAKKRYILNVFDSEGVRYSSPKLKIMGIETTRSSTPAIVRKELKECISIIMNKDEDTFIDYIQTFKQTFLSLPPDQIAFPRSVNGLSKYADSTTIYKKSTPIAVKGALIYNHHIKKMKLGKKYKQIQEGEKVKFIYLKTPNPFGGSYGNDHVISFPNTIPKEFELEEYIDKKLQFEKTFIDPLNTILVNIGWSTEKQNTLESLFS